MKLDLVHGGALDTMRSAFPDAPARWMDLSTGINPWPYPDVDVTLDALARLPTQAASDACRDAMAHAIDAEPDAVLLAPGSELLIHLLPDVIRPRTVAVHAPTYGDHALVWRRAGADVTQIPNPLTLADVADVVVVCNPNNPDGQVFALRDLDCARRALAARGGWLIVDEAYADLDPGFSLAAHRQAEGLILLRSFGKFYGLAGLRLGALIAPRPVRRAMADRLGVWPVSGMALEVGARAYRDQAWRGATRDRLAAASRRLDGILDRTGVKRLGGTALFRYVEVERAHRFWRGLAQNGVYVRRFDGSERHLRIGLPASAEEETRLEATLSSLG